MHRLLAEGSTYATSFEGKSLGRPRCPWPGGIGAVGKLAIVILNAGVSGVGRLKGRRDGWWTERGTGWCWTGRNVCGRSLLQWAGQRDSLIQSARALVFFMGQSGEPRLA